MSERAERVAMSRGGVLLRRDPARDIEELRAFEAERESEHWARLRRTLRGPVMAGRNLADMAANTDPGITDPLQSGVIGSGDFLVSAGVVTGATGAFSATVAAGVSWVPDANGLLRRVVRANGGAVNFGIPPGLPAAGSTRTYTLTVDSSGVFGIVAAAASVGGNVAPNGLNFLPGNGSMALANVAIINSAGTYQLAGGNVNWIQGVNWIDRRPWARGASYRYSRTAANYSISSTVSALIDAANMSPRVECSGVPLSVRLEHATFQHPNGAELDVYLNVDGAQFGRIIHSLPVGYSSPRVSFDFTPAAGSHLLQLYWTSSTGTITLYGQAGGPSVSMVVEEIVRQNASNGAQ